MISKEYLLSHLAEDDREFRQVITLMNQALEDDRRLADKLKSEDVV